MSFSKITVALLTIAFCFCSTVQAQTDSLGKRLLIVVEHGSENRPLISDIQQCMENMTYGANQEQRIYSEVINFNMLIKTIVRESRVNQFTKLINPDTAKVSTNSRLVFIRDSIYYAQLIQYDRKLNIDVVKQDSLEGSNFTYYEYRFTLYRVVKEQGKIPVPIFMAQKSIVVNPLSPDAKGLIRYQLLQLSEESQIPPRVKLKCNAVFFKNRYVFALEDTLLLQTTILDQRQDHELYQYAWAQDISNRKTYDGYRSWGRTQTLVFHDTGSYQFSVKVSIDQVSVIDTIHIQIINRPQIVSVSNYYSIKINGKQGRITHPFNALYQTFLLADTIQIIRFNGIHLKLRQQVSSMLRIRFHAVQPKLGATDSSTTSEFKVFNNSAQEPGELLLVHSAKDRSAGTYSYTVVVSDRGIQSLPHLFEVKYRKVRPVYFEVGVTLASYQANRSGFSGFSSLGIGTFIHPRVQVEYSLNFPLEDSLFGHHKSFKYTNHHLVLIAPLPLLPRGVIAGPELDFEFFNHPAITDELVSGVGFGLHLKLLYLPFPWLGTYTRLLYHEVRQLPGQVKIPGFFSIDFGVVFQFISKH